MQLENTKPRWGTLVVLFLLLGALAAVPFFLFQGQPGAVASFEVQNFIGPVKVYYSQKNAWNPPQRGGLLRAGDKIQTGPGGEIDLWVPNQIAIRMKENSEVEVRKPGFFIGAPRYRLHLLRGALLGATEKEYGVDRLEITTPVLVAAVRGTTFLVESKPETNESSVSVLKGSVAVRAVKARKSVVVRSLEKTEVKGDAPPKQPTPVTRQEWDKMKEGYELALKSAAREARQLDLSKEAGNLFQYVFDHGAFYTEKFGFADREFVEDKGTGKASLKVEYDVFPTGSFVGVYVKTRNLDLSKFQGLSFQARGDKEEGFPESFRIELKSGFSIVRLFIPRDFKPIWQTFQFPIAFSRPTPITEVAFVFTNEKAGEHKKGVLYLRDFTLVPGDKVPPAKQAPTIRQAPAAEKAAS